MKAKNDVHVDLQGKGHGKVKLRMKYMSLEAIYSQPRTATVVCLRTPLAWSSCCILIKPCYVYHGCITPLPLHPQFQQGPTRNKVTESLPGSVQQEHSKLSQARGHSAVCEACACQAASCCRCIVELEVLQHETRETVLGHKVLYSSSPSVTHVSNALVYKSSQRIWGLI